LALFISAPLGTLKTLFRRVITRPLLTIFGATGDPGIKALAKEFVAEERGQVAELQKWIAAHKAGQALPVDH
jgi:hypothetical protein